MNPRTVSMFGIVNWASTGENLGFANIKVQTSLCIGSLISTFAICLLENIVSRLASIKYTHIFPITIIINDGFNFQLFIVRRLLLLNRQSLREN